MPELEKQRKYRIGEMLLDYGLITHDQLAKALERQMTSGRRIGSLLQDMGLVDGDILLNILSRQLETPPVNLFEVKVAPDVLKLISFEQVKAHRVLPFEHTGGHLSLAMVDPGDTGIINDVEHSVGAAVRPFIVPDSQMEKAIAVFEKDGYGGSPFDGGKLHSYSTIQGTRIPGIHSLLRLLPDFRATALHLTAGAQPSMRIDGVLKRLSMPRISPALIKEYALEILPSEKIADFESGRDVDFVISMPEKGRYRITLYKQRNSVAMSAQCVFDHVPSFSELNLPQWLSDFAMKESGLILIAGLPGQGKATTLAAFVREINHGRRCNIVTLEEPIHYLHRHQMSNVNQREIGIDADSFSSGLRRIQAQDPDVIVVEDLMDAECISSALRASEAGHLVIGAINSPDALSAVDRIIRAMPENLMRQSRVQLAGNLLLVFAQKLLPGLDGSGRVPAYEKLINSTRVGNLIRDAKTANLRTLTQVAAEDVSAMDQSIARLCLDGIVSFEQGLLHADDPEYYQELIRTGRA